MEPEKNLNSESEIENRNIKSEKMNDLEVLAIVSLGAFTLAVAGYSWAEKMYQAAKYFLEF